MTSTIATLLTIMVLLAGCDFAVPSSDGLTPAKASPADERQDATGAMDDTTNPHATNDDGQTADTDGQGLNDDGETAEIDAQAPNDAPVDGADDHGVHGSAVNADSDAAVDATMTDGAAHTLHGGTGDMLVPDVGDGLPQGHAGSGQVLQSTRKRIDRKSTVAVFRTRCDFSHMAFDDPIVSPGQPGASHLHAFFGNTGTDANSTTTSIATSGNSTCRGGIANRTGYWVPALLDVETRKPVAPKMAQIYYRSGYGGVAADNIRPMPDGLRMVAGNAASTGNANENPRIHWQCRYDGKIPNPEVRTPHIPPDCGRGDTLRLTVDFPQCWDGASLDASDHKSHMAYAKRGCPDSHPVPLPQVVVNVVYELGSSAAQGWRLSSDSYDRNLPGGMSLHADWFNGWDRQFVNTWLNNCFKQPRNCKDGNLNDGTGLDRP